MNIRIKKFEDFIFEGGWASKLTQSSTIKPSVIVKAEDFIVKFLEDFNSSRDYELVPMTPVGSGINYKKDLEETPEKTYGDIDYLVKIVNLEESRENLHRCNLDIIDFIREKKPNSIALEDTLRESNKSSIKLIVQIEGNYYQIDLILAFESYAEWTAGRLSPAEGYKGFVSGSLYSSLGKILKMSISETGVKAKTESGNPVDFQKRSGVVEEIVSRNYRNMFENIIEYFAKRDGMKHLKFSGYKPLDNRKLTLEILCYNIKRLFDDLEETGTFAKWPQYGIKDAEDGISQLVKDYEERIDRTLSSTKFDKAESESALASLKKAKMQGEAAKLEVRKFLVD